jgi:hypothetical protein
MIFVILDVFLEALVLQYLISMLVRWTNSAGNAFRADPFRAVLAWEALWHLFIAGFIMFVYVAPSYGCLR